MRKILIYVYILLITTLTIGCLNYPPINQEAVTKCCTKMFYAIGYDVTVGIYEEGCIIHIINCHDPDGDLESRSIDLMNTVVNIGASFKKYNGVDDGFLILVKYNNLVLGTTAGECNEVYELHEKGKLTPEKLNGIFKLLKLNDVEKKYTI